MINFKVFHGTTRTTILLFKLAIKIPIYKSWEGFLGGLLGNMHEKRFYASLKGYVPPMYFYIPGGWMTACARCDVHPTDVTHAEIFFHTLANNQEDSLSKVLLHVVEYKADSVGIYKDSIVAVDYGASGCMKHNLLKVERDIEMGLDKLIKPMKIGYE